MHPAVLEGCSQLLYRCLTIERGLFNSAFSHDEFNRGDDTPLKPGNHVPQLGSGTFSHQCVKPQRGRAASRLRRSALPLKEVKSKLDPVSLFKNLEAGLRSCLPVAARIGRFAAVTFCCPGDWILQLSTSQAHEVMDSKGRWGSHDPRDFCKQGRLVCDVHAHMVIYPPSKPSFGQGIARALP